MSMPTISPFEQFCHDFFGIFTQPAFKGGDYLAYLNRPAARRTGDEAAIVDTVIVGPLLGLLGFEPGSRIYNQNRGGTRPDYAPIHPNYGTCFIVEDKSTAETLTLDLNDPNSHINQLFGYLRGLVVPLGWLTNGKILLVFRRETAAYPLATLDIPAAVAQWMTDQTMNTANEQALRTLWDHCCAEVFAGSAALLHDITLEESVWLAQATPLGAGTAAGESLLVEMVKALLDELRADASQRLTAFLQRSDMYRQRAERLTDASQQLAVTELAILRERMLESLQQIQGALRVSNNHLSEIDDVLRRAIADVGAFRSTSELRSAIDRCVDSAVGPDSGTGWRSRAEAFSQAIDAPFKTLSTAIIGWHGRQATLRAEYRTALAVADDYAVWTTLVQETMLGGLNEDERRLEFATQTAYVVFIRLLLIRVCEDKGVLPARMLSDGGIKHWHEEAIPRYLAFVTGNRYEPLLQMAYSNAQNIYAHFFSGRELFNWYALDERHVLMALHRLNRFNFAAVDSDIVGTIYSTYISREEKRHKGQYYTPVPIVQTILDQVGYSGAAVINRRLIDPACGSGSFLVAAAKRLVNTYQAQAVDDPATVLERVRNALFGFDLNPFACYLAEVNLLIQVLDLVKAAEVLGQRQPIERFHIYNIDALSQPSGTFPIGSTLLAAENQIVEQIRARAEGSVFANGFHFVVANPPYGATLSETYKATLRTDWPTVFYGQPDTYTFFMALGVRLLADGGRLGYITPNTFLMGSNTAALRRELAAALVIEQLVDLPQGIWRDANVDCVLLFGRRERAEPIRRAHTVTVHTLALADSLAALTDRRWRETLTHPQATWMDDPEARFNLRYDDLMRRIEAACTVATNGKPEILRLEDVTEINRGVEPYHSREQGKSAIFIKPKNQLASNENHWKPLLDSNSQIGRYSLTWHSSKPHLNYGSWLYRAYQSKYYELPKLLFIRLRNRSLKRRLVATYDEQKFYNRHNYTNIIAKYSNYNLKYILALFNSTLLNFWYNRQFANVEISIDNVRRLPIYPADSATQAELVGLVDQLLAEHAALNTLREQGYRIEVRRNGQPAITVPADGLLARLTRANPAYPVLSLFDALASGMLTVTDKTSGEATVSSNVFVPAAHPTSVVLRHAKWWLNVPDDDLRRYLVAYLRLPQWQGQPWSGLKNSVVVPADAAALALFWHSEIAERAAISDRLGRIAQLDAELDAKIFALYDLSSVDIGRIVGRQRASAPVPRPISRRLKVRRPTRRA